MSEILRGERLQIMLAPEELTAVDNWRFSKRMPSRAAAVRELLRLGLAAVARELDEEKTHSRQYAVVDGLGPASISRKSSKRNPGKTKA
jgi:hypothetical protein